ncbi:cytochrome c biogenesis protein DipZ [Caballeronia concitans]|uniref:Cytochrome c biogenesis protein, transmembrane region n=1 Tax=Caballeronia concitans TaxID=1777133 RepID=A0A658QUA7_9BURK|nr:cytochrome c biogenesis protein DipZ [Caballeronia concitans]KIG09917.1 cytochrome c biogenesis protein transmembrane region [Burkholderia sp. MR1]SAL22674.1 cytochrome c biogenesis protein, transmembrane region [Caballeronia concitans]
MLLIVIALLGGAFTILSPCILPVVPFIFARSDRPFLTDRLPLLAGLAGTFALVTSLGAAGLAGAAQFNQYGRWIALAMLALFGASLMLPAVATRITRPLSALADRLIARSQAQDASRSIVPSLLLGAATGLLWAPCAGPILGAILSGAALDGATWKTGAALAAYAAGAAFALAVASSLGKRALDALKRSSGLGEHVRRAMGALVLLSVATIAAGADTRVLALVKGVSTDGIESRLVGLLSARDEKQKPHIVRASTPMPPPLPVEGTLPALDGATQWLNSPPLSRDALRGKVVVVNFWTYSCINCLRTLPYLKTWAQRYGNDGLVVLGVHTPEFGFEHDTANVKRALRDLNVSYPVAVDNDYRIWQAFGNRYWPAFYIVDAEGRVRYHHFGEGNYDDAERSIRQLLGKTNEMTQPSGDEPAKPSGTQVAADPAHLESNETYLGYGESQGATPEQRVIRDASTAYTLPQRLALNDWGIGGQWNVRTEAAVASASHARLAYRFHARDLHLVLAPADDGKPVCIRITIDGKPPGASHGADIDADGNGVVTAARLYQLVRQSGPVDDRTFEIEFLDAGARAYAFTFG